MKNHLDQILEFWLPNMSSRLIAGLSITLGIASVALPEFLTLLYIKPANHVTLLIRLVSPLLIWLLGSLIVLHRVVQHFKVFRGQFTTLEKNMVILMDEKTTLQQTTENLKLDNADKDSQIRVLEKQMEKIKRERNKPPQSAPPVDAYT